MRILITTIGLLLASGSFSQNSFIGLSAGVSQARTTMSEGQRTGLTAVLNYRYEHSWLVLEGTLDYSQKGSRDELSFSNSSGQVSDKKHFDLVYNYLGIGVKAGVRYGDRLFGYTTIGLTPAFLLEGHSHYEGVTFPDGSTYPERRATIDMTRFDLSVGLETTVGYRIGDHSGIFLTLGANTGIWNVKENQGSILSNAEWKNHNYTARIGYQFLL